ncbi:MAG: helix-turn-helix transcriptional regulator [Clostridia bacterium]|nr:helix-turn-helix transcriptional regulator [Clostridia bacterium]
MKSINEYMAEQMRDPEFAKAYEEIQPEMTVIRAIVDARTSRNLTQKELSERTGIAQTEISKLERGTRNPSIKLLQRLADGMDMVLNVSFTPKSVPGSAKTAK